MKAKIFLLSLAMLMGVSVLADDVLNYNVYDDCSKNGYKGGYTPDVQAVDLGLSSGIKWASCNVGAWKPEDYGNYYAWGEVLPKEDYSWATYKYANSDRNKLTKYCNNASFGNDGFTDNKTTLEPEDDAAHMNWGGAWRMPTDAEWTEVRENCIWTWTTQNGVNGYQVISKTNGNSIFLPATGRRYNADLENAGLRGYYWSSSLAEHDSLQETTHRAGNVNFGSDDVKQYNNIRCTGMSVRPVSILSSTPSSACLTLYTSGCENADTIICYARQQVNVTAVPAHEHRHFVRWSDGNTDNPRLVTVTQDMTLTAEFTDDPILTLVSANSRGRLYGEGQFKPNTSCQIYAIPDHGYHFVQWNDGNTDNPRTIVLTCDTTFTAEFAQTFSGQCGENLHWKYVGHTLSITGSGNMYNYSGYDYDYVPWFLFRDTTDAIVLEQGITHIGNNAFNGFVKLGKIDLPSTLTSIGAYAFAGCRKLYDIYSYAVEPPMADNSSFANYNVNLYVPCDNLRGYQMDALFGSFKYILCIGADNADTDGKVIVTPSDNEVEITWPSDSSADTYSLVITQDGKEVCTLIFNSNGQLMRIAFAAPSRNGATRHAPAAVLTQSGYRFTVTGLNSGTRYAYAIDVKDKAGTSLNTYKGTFITTVNGTPTDVEDVVTDTSLEDNAPRKVFRDGQVYILREGKTYTLTGEEMLEGNY